MSRLDFSELPSATPTSHDPEAFERFAKDFFLVTRQAIIIKTVARGADGGADLVLEVNGERLLVSCKHYAGSVGPGDEEDVAGRLRQWGCAKFVGFYSSGPSAGLERRLRETAEKNPDFKYEILDHCDIEREILTVHQSAGWLLAMRWFPASYAKLGSSPVRPLSIYSEVNVVNASNRAFVPGFGVVAHFREGDVETANAAVREIAEMANESETRKVFGGAFLSRITEFAAMVPGAFEKRRMVPDRHLMVSSVFPTWDLAIVRRLAVAQRLYGLQNLCRIWSLWGYELACASYLYGRQYHRLWGMDADLPREEWQGVYDAHGRAEEFLEQARDLPERCVFARQWIEELSFSYLATHAFTLERGFFSSLLCFCPGALHSWLDRTSGIASLATVLGEEPNLRSAAWSLVQTLSKHDQEYVKLKSPNLRELLVSLQNVMERPLDVLRQRHPGLRCLRESLTEPWLPDAPVDANLRDALGL